MKKLSIIATAVVCLTICSCSGRSQHNNRDIRMSIDSAAIEGNGYLILPSYNITSRIGEDSVLLCYNYKSHAIDRFNLKSKKTLSPIQLNIDGPDGIPGRVNTISVVDDSLIAVNDGIRQYLIDTDGHVVERYEYPLSANSIVSRNARTHNASLALSADGRQLRYPVFSSDTIAMVYFDIREDIDSFKTYEITRLTGAHEYGFLLYPNVSSTDSLVIFNYPYESTFTVLDINTGKQLTVDDHSRFAPDRAKKCPKDDIEKMTRHGFVNPCYFELEYLPDLDIYAQLYLGIPEDQDSENLDKVMHSRPICLKLFDRNFNKIGEWQLDSRRYDPYMGWRTLDDGLLMFKSNILNDAEESDDIISYDIIRFHEN